MTKEGDDARLLVFGSWIFPWSCFCSSNGTLLQQAALDFVLFGSYRAEMMATISVAPDAENRSRLESLCAVVLAGTRTSATKPKCGHGCGEVKSPTAASAVWASLTSAFLDWGF